MDLALCTVDLYCNSVWGTLRLVTIVRSIHPFDDGLGCVTWPDANLMSTSCSAAYKSQEMWNLESTVVLQEVGTCYDDVLSGIIPKVPFQSRVKMNEIRVLSNLLSRDDVRVASVRGLRVFAGIANSVNPRIHRRLNIARTPFMQVSMFFHPLLRIWPKKTIHKGTALHLSQPCYCLRSGLSVPLL